MGRDQCPKGFRRVADRVGRAFRVRQDLSERFAKVLWL
jgi:hypothetical protein